MDLLAAGQFNILVLCPIIAIVVGVVLVFHFGFKRPDELKFKKSSVSGNDAKKAKKKDTKKQPATPNGQVTKSTATAELARKERSAESNAKKSPVKEVKPKKTPARSDNVAKKDAKLAATAKVTKKDKSKEKAVQEKKPADYDDGNWMTVPTKNDKKKSKSDDVTNSPKPAKVEASIVEKKNAKNAKQLKDQANKSKKEAEDAAATKELKSIEVANIKPVAVVPVPEPSPPKAKPAVIDEEAKQTAEIIEKIQEAIVDVVIEPVVVQKIKDKDSVSKSISKKIVADREEKVDEIKPVESNVAFDELADAWTEAKPTKKNKKKVRKD